MNNTTPQTIYHYSDVDGFFNILKNQKLWLSSPHNLNDHQEVNWALEKIKSTLERLAGKYSNTHIDFIKSFLKNNRLSPFTCSLSAEGDLLSQWRAYARDGSGVSIGFNRELLPHTGSLPSHNLKTENSITTMQVIYDDKEQNEKIEEILIAALDAASEQGSHAGALSTAAMQLNGLSTIYKNKAFREENEWRIIHTPLIMLYTAKDKGGPFHSGISEAKHRISNEKLITYFEYDFSHQAANNIITEVILGPRCAIQEFDLKLFLSINNLGHIQPRRSTASYR